MGLDANKNIKKVVRGGGRGIFKYFHNYVQGQNGIYKHLSVRMQSVWRAKIKRSLGGRGINYQN